MIGADVLNNIHARLQNITGNYDNPFGGMPIVFCGDLRQLPPVNARPVYKPSVNSMHGAVLWQSLDFYPLVKVMRQTNEQFSTILTKIGNGERLTSEETELIEIRFRSAEWCKQNLPGAVRLFLRNADVERYNAESLVDRDTVDCGADDNYSGYRNDQQLASARSTVHKMSVMETGGLPYLLRFAVGIPYMITTKIDVEDGIVNGAIGELKYVEFYEDDPQQPIVKIWIKFENDSIGKVLRVKSRPAVYSKPGILQPDWTPVCKRSTSIKLSSSIKCKRVQFPLVGASALTVHKSQGGTFPEIVYEYDKGQEQQLVYVGLSRVTSIEGLFLTNANNVLKFHHAKGTASPRIQELRTELQRLGNHTLVTLGSEMLEFITTGSQSAVLMSLNVQSLNAHSKDLSTDPVLTKADNFALS
ncbi:ATP-dependent DNA helicase PIF1-like [Wyeomyia smithii]|uniref:ATP-dependent DNA helicase PIF1-like n=1 Tax=Wyeomyia smithii TaxID=174621 RepID=UPI0024680CA3|nr:ATP-dependent DNA helicase PIF1-like [Wyeomyia smithii]